VRTIQKNTKKQTAGIYQPKKDKSLLFIRLAVLGLFIGIFLCMGLCAITLIDFYDLSKILIGFAIVGFLIPLKYYSKWFHFIKYEMIIFNVIGVAPFFTGLFLVLNFLLASNLNTQEYKIEKLYYDNGRFMGVVLENNTFSEEPKIVAFPNSTIKEIAGKEFLELTLAKGLFGFEVIKERKFID